MFFQTTITMIVYKLTLLIHRLKKIISVQKKQWNEILSKIPNWVCSVERVCWFPWALLCMVRLGATALLCVVQQGMWRCFAQARSSVAWDSNETCIISLKILIWWWCWRCLGKKINKDNFRRNLRGPNITWAVEWAWYLMNFMKWTSFWRAQPLLGKKKN